MIAPVARDMTPKDRRFVVPSWARSCRLNMPLRDRFALVDSLIDGGARVVVMGGPYHTVFSWACGTADTLHFVYVDPELRHRRLARRAIEALFGAYPDHVNVSHEWPRASSRFRYVPDLLLRTAA